MRAGLVAALVAAGCGSAPPLVPAREGIGPAAPRPLEPDRDARVETLRPTFRWALAPGTDGAVVEICADRLCGWVVHSFAATGDHLVADLPTGVYYWRLAGRSHRLVGEGRSELRVLAVDPTVRVQGTHLALAVPADERRAGELLVATADRAFPVFAALLGVTLPAEQAFFHVGGGQHVMWRSAPEDLAGRRETGLLRLLARGVQEERVRLYKDQPHWFAEGMLELLAVRGLAGDGADALERLPESSRRLHRLREAVAEGKLIPLRRLLEIDATTELSPEEHERFQDESFALLYVLDSPSDPARRQRFRAFLREVTDLRGFVAAWRINRRLLAEFGELAVLEKTWLDGVRATPLYRWRLHGIGRGLADGLVLVGGPDEPARALADEAPIAAGTRIEAEVAPRTDDPWQAKEVDLLFGYRGKADYYRVSFGRSGACALHRHSAEFPQGNLAHIAPRRFPRGTFERGDSHRVAVDVMGDRVIARIDGGAVLEAPLAEPVEGRWGVGARQGYMEFHALRAGPIPSEPAP